ncbi:MAG: hypothetical protein AAB533_03750, partial [Patescibacteria group bacterium]
PGTAGEIIMRGDNVIAGYYGDAAESRAAFQDGWFYTGDLGYRDADGFYFLSGRKKEMINRGGFKISPLSIDNVLLALPGIREAAAVGVPDPIYGEEVVAFVAWTPAASLSEDDIRAHCGRYLTPAECPKKIFFIDEVPKTASGKIMRRALLERYHMITTRNA